MTKAELIDALRGDFTRRQTEEMVDMLFDAVSDSLVNDGRFAYPGFGTFTVKSRAARTGTNPRTGEPIKIPASRTVVFRPAAKLKDSL